MSAIEERALALVEAGLAEDFEDAVASLEDDELEETDDWDGWGEGK